MATVGGRETQRNLWHLFGETQRNLWHLFGGTCLGKPNETYGTCLGHLFGHLFGGGYQSVTHVPSLICHPSD
jgi:hypothetical protein